MPAEKRGEAQPRHAPPLLPKEANPGAPAGATGQSTGPSYQDFIDVEPAGEAGGGGEAPQPSYDDFVGQEVPDLEHDTDLTKDRHR